MTTGAIERLINQVGQADNAGDLSYYIDGQTYVDAGEEILDLRAEVERLTADLSTCQDGNVDLLNENHELRKELHTYQQMWAHVVKERDALKNEVEAAKQTINFLMDQLHPQDSQP